MNTAPSKPEINDAYWFLSKQAIGDYTRIANAENTPGSAMAKECLSTVPALVQGHKDTKKFLNKANIAMQYIHRRQVEIDNKLAEFEAEWGEFEVDATVYGKTTEQFIDECKAYAPVAIKASKASAAKGSATKRKAKADGKTTTKKPKTSSLFISSDTSDAESTSSSGSSDGGADEETLGAEKASILRMLRDPKNKFMNTVGDLFTDKAWKQAQAVYHPDHNDGDDSRWGVFNTAKDWFNTNVKNAYHKPTPADFKAELGL